MKETQMLSKKALLEVSDLSHKAESLARGSATDREQARVLCQRISTIRETGYSDDEMRGQFADALVEDTAARKPNEVRHKKLFENYLVTGQDKELRDFLAGTESISFTQGPAGGFTIPNIYDDTVRIANRQVDPVLDPDVTSFSQTDGPQLSPSRVSGYDLSTITATATSEGSQQTSQTIPPASGAGLNANLIFKTTLVSTQEMEQDAANFGNLIVKAGSVALGRAIAKSAMVGQGGNEINGIINTIGTTPGLQFTPGKLVLDDLLNYVWSVNAFYRHAPKCGWLVSDGFYKMVRRAQDNQGRPLLSVHDDDETIFGYPVYLSPSLATPFTSIGFVGNAIFGDLSAIIVKTSRPTVKRVVQSSIADITQGKSAYIFRCRADAVYLDLSGGKNPPLVMGSVL